MTRKTITIQVVVETAETQSQMRTLLRNALCNPESPLHKGLRLLGWTGNPLARSFKVSHAKRTEGWPV
jgi:hypothetical protein